MMMRHWKGQELGKGVEKSKALTPHAGSQPGTPWSCTRCFCACVVCGVGGWWVGGSETKKHSHARRRKEQPLKRPPKSKA